jgi:hypothetical protein
MDVEVPVAFAVRQHDPPALEVRVNFGLLAGRAATPAELDRLAEWLLDSVGAVSIVAEDRHEIDAHGEAAVTQVRIEVAGERVPHEFAERRELENRVVERASHWVRVCAAERHIET